MRKKGLGMRVGLRGKRRKIPALKSITDEKKEFTNAGGGLFAGEGESGK